MVKIRMGYLLNWCPFKSCLKMAAPTFLNGVWLICLMSTVSESVLQTSGGWYEEKRRAESDC